MIYYPVNDNEYQFHKNIISHLKFIINTKLVKKYKNIKIYINSENKKSPISRTLSTHIHRIKNVY